MKPIQIPPHKPFIQIPALKIPIQTYLFKLLPFLIMPLITPVYNILDSLLFVDIFGCGCVPSAQENMLGIGFNANDLRWSTYALLTVWMTVWGWRLMAGDAKPAADGTELATGDTELAAGGAELATGDTEPAADSTEPVGNTVQNPSAVCRILYALSVLLFNLALGYHICRSNLWA